MRKHAFFIGLLLLVCLSGVTVSFAAPAAEITWYGHAAFKIVTPGGKVMLVDPWIANPANPNGKKDIEGLAKVDLIFLTHGHSDHIGNTLEIANKTGAKLVATADLQRAMAAYKGFPEKQIDRAAAGSFGGTITLLGGEVTVLFVPAVHGGSMDTDKGPVYAGHPGGFVISVANGPRIYHTGDTDLFSDMMILKGDVDIMLVCIGDKFTMGPVRGAKAVQMIMPKMAVPMHFGTFPVLTGTVDQFRAELGKLGLAALLRPMKVGETLTWK